MSEGTSLEDIESGNVAYGADADAMNAILSDMNAVEEPQQAPVYIPPPQVQQPPQPLPAMQPQYEPEPNFQFPQFPQLQHNTPMYEVVEPMQSQQPQQVSHVSASATKKNAWSSLFDDIREPLVVGLLVTLFSLPGLHTWLSKRLTWAYKVGGSLSWIGFLIQFALVAGLFATYRQIMQVAGL